MPAAANPAKVAAAPQRCSAAGTMVKQAIVRPPSATFADGLTSVNLGVPDVGKAREQHARYCAALEQCGVRLIRLEPVDEGRHVRLEGWEGSFASWVVGACGTECRQRFLRPGETEPGPGPGGGDG